MLWRLKVILYLSILTFVWVSVKPIVVGQFILPHRLGYELTVELVFCYECIAFYVLIDQSLVNESAIC